ncbi:MAG TPA: phospholipase D-like domain-containing protein [Vicinamibacterales bacterium]|nr:phospholipase D-like domain-containing protein [Vicinamibacterales bacterium]
MNWYLALIGALFLTWVVVVALFTPRIDYKVHRRLACGSKEFLHALHSTTQTTIHHDSHFEVLTNASQFYPAMLEAIHGAQVSVTMECYIFRGDEIGTQFMAALTDRARTGVAVSLVIDAIGSFWLGVRGISRLREAGVRVKQYQRLKWYRLARINNRTHRELLIVDGKVAFVGGAGVGDQWAKGRHGKRPWRDTMARVTGPVVSAIQGVAAENWVECCGEIMTGNEFFPTLRNTGDTTAIVIKSSPADRATTARVVFQMLIECAEKSIRINTPYFLPDRSLREAFKQTARRGVKIDIIVPGSHTDQRWVRLVSRRKYRELLKEGIRIHEYRAGMMHAKILNVDDLWVVLGTPNFDNRSFEHNDEVNVAIRDEAMSARLRKDFREDMRHCEEVTMETWRRRPLLEKIVEPFCWFLERQQ